MPTMPRRTPQQPRSQRRREAILHATAQLLSEMEYAVMSVQDIAQRAETSVGSLYQYFPTKDALLQALTEMYLVDMQAISSHIFAKHESLPPLDVVFNQAINAHIEYGLAHPGFKTILKSEWVSPEMKSAIDALYNEMKSGISNVIGWYAPSLSAPERDAGASVIMALVEGLLLNLPHKTPAEQAILITHFKQAGLAYLKTIVV